jgi:nuclear pore complex protein Nup133
LARQSANSSSTIQTTNDTYTVSKLPAFPDRLRTDATGLHLTFSTVA